jgi:tetratricopeptide (TPR) repeat protein
MKIFALTTLVLGLLGAVLLGGVAAESRSAGTGAPSTPAAAESLRSEFGSGDTVSLLRQLQDRARLRPADAGTQALLGLAYAQRARETGDPAFYSRAEGVLRRAHRLDPKDLYALTGLGGVALARHRFSEALGLGRSAAAVAPGAAAPLGVVGDAQLELGRYREAFATFDRMTALKPNTSSYARVSYARELRGDVAGAIGAMELALDASIGRPEARAWTAVELGKLHWSVGRIGRAASFYRLALQLVPGYAPALDALARVEAARGHPTRAIALQRQAVAAIPLPAYVVQLADLLAASGLTSAADEQYALVEAIDRLQAANGVTLDLETALYRVDHGIRLEQSLALARRARAARPSILGDDVLAWALARTGRCGEALAYSKRSLRLGTRDAVLYFHRGMIERCLGRPASARAWFDRALATNPNFSLHWSPIARRYAS